MLLNLPLDILIDITLYLSISEKLQLVLTCKRLKDAIFDQYFYETIDMVFYDKEKTESVVLKFRKNRSHGEKVKVLTIQLQDLSNQLLSQIPLIFPNVVEFHDYSYMEKTRPDDTFSEFMNWKDTLKYATYSNVGCESEIPVFIYSLLEKNEFSHLTTLTLSPIVKHDESQIHFLDCIKNAPALKYLSLKTISVTLEDMENIHSYCPLLVTLDMTMCIIIVTEDEPLFKKTTPALCLSNFTLTSTSICDQQCVFLSYLTLKYTKLTKLELFFDFSENGLKALFPHQSIEQMRTNPDFIARWNVLHLTNESYIASASNILSSLPSTLRVLLITSTNLRNTMALFTKKCINITRLDFLGGVYVCDTFFTSPQNITVFQNLHLLKYLSMMLDPSLQKYDKAPASNSVTNFEVIIKGSSEDNDMDIGWILLMFPSLYSLKIKYSGTRLIGYESDPPSKYPNLIQLSIGPSATHSNLLPFIRDTAPNLQDLHWNIFGSSVKEYLEANHSNRDIILRPNEPEIKNNRAYYRIDLNGFLNCFYLNIDLRENDREDHEDIFLKIKKKDETEGRFLIQDQSDGRVIHSMDYIREDVKAKIKTKIIINYNYTKMIDINSDTLIDLEKSRIQLKY